jgi:hypothetical protein
MIVLKNKGNPKIVYHHFVILWPYGEKEEKDGFGVDY